MSEALIGVACTEALTPLAAEALWSGFVALDTSSSIGGRDVSEREREGSVVLRE